MSQDLEALRYPIGRFRYQPGENISQRIETIRHIPARIKRLLASADDSLLDTPYRPEGWTIRQLVHHVADSHLNAYVRFKLALTEEVPTIKPYEEAAWAKLPDSRLPIGVSLQLLESIHQRWSVILDNMKAEDFERKLFHPEQKKELSLDVMLSLYHWHSEHHFAHMQLVINS
ncbi:MAG: putative metal-dependent hydrolase [Saprospiraceae bacterium]|nr:MAG: putative metal-dependent hydrolase [Saprospiraceae bacterium]